MSDAVNLVADSALREKREKVFLVLAGCFLAAMAMLNVVGITHFIALGPLSLAVGVLPYPITFLCTDLISELYGKTRANFVVWLGFALNLFILFVVWLGDALPAVGEAARPPWQDLAINGQLFLPNGESLSGTVELFHIIYACTSGAVFASMVAYLAAQFCDVHLFHFWKKLTKGKHLWLRNNGSTLVSQLVDSLAVVGITFGAAFMRGEKTFEIMLVLLASNYAFKVVAALVDTIPLYFLVNWLRGYLKLSENEEVTY